MRDMRRTASLKAAVVTYGRHSFHEHKTRQRRGFWLGRSLSFTATAGGGIPYLVQGGECMSDSRPHQNRIEIVEEQMGGFHRHDIRPKYIDTAGAGVGSFGKAEVEWTARLLVRFFQERDVWVRFTLGELVDFARQQGENDPSLFGLL